MTTPENSLSRWSRLKLEAASRVRAGADQHDAPAHSVEPAKTRPEDGFDAGLADSEDLPPIDAITVDTDIRAFLKSRVPAELTRAALHRAWISDPAIRDFIGIAENQWDFNDPTGIAGFGPLQRTDDISALLEQAFGPPAELATAIVELPLQMEPLVPTEIVREIGVPDQPDIRAASNATTTERPDSAYPGAEPESHAPPKRRSHGGALPR